MLGCKIAASALENGGFLEPAFFLSVCSQAECSLLGASILDKKGALVSPDAWAPALPQAGTHESGGCRSPGLFKLLCGLKPLSASIWDTLIWVRW